jgi:enoyl-CoA hydratase/carnithine racemase
MTTVLYEKHDQIAYITLNRPDSLNAINDDLAEGLTKALEDYRDDPSLLVAIISGAGRAFSAGADLKEMSNKGQAGGDRDVTHQFPLGLKVWKPIIAAIDGYALAGGFLLSLQCDIRIATERSKMGIVVTRIGTIGEEALLNLARMIPVGEALYLFLTGTQIDAYEAHRIGLVHKVLPDKKALMEEATAIAEEIKLAAPLANQAARRLIYTSMSESPEEILKLARHLKEELGKTEDAKEGPRAFAEKRKPMWKMR